MDYGVTAHLVLRLRGGGKPIVEEEEKWFVICIYLYISIFMNKERYIKINFVRKKRCIIIRYI